MAVDASVSTSASDRAYCLPRRIKPGDRRQAELLAETAKVLADPIRVQILGLLRDAEAAVCQCDLNPLFAISQPTLSHHLHKLTDGGLVSVERRGKWAYYSINEHALEALRSW